MKKLTSLMLGLSIALGTVAMFAQDTKPTDAKKSTAAKKTKKTKAPKKDTTKTSAIN